jgi:rare lipoprotein A
VGKVVSSGTCAVSYYDEPQGTASGEQFDPEAFTAAHKTLPFNTRVRVTNLANGKSTVVRINDRGPYAGDRCLDLARAPFQAIVSLSSGVIDAKYEVLG